MVKRIILILLVLIVAAGAVLAALPKKQPEIVAKPEESFWEEAAPMTGEAYFPSEENWTYHYTYRYPELAGDGNAAILVNEAYRNALDEMLNLVLPMFANASEMLYDGHNEIVSDYQVTCHTDQLYSVLQTRSQTMGEETMLTLEAQVFALDGPYQGEPLTLRGTVGEWVGESSDQIAAAVLPELYAAFQELQAEGIVNPVWTQEDFETEFSPMAQFYANQEGSVVFFLPPMLLTTPSFDVPTWTYSPERLHELTLQLPENWEDDLY